MYFPKEGILLPLSSVPLKGLVYEGDASAPRTAVELRARTAGALTPAAERRARRDAVERVAIVNVVQLEVERREEVRECGGRRCGAAGVVGRGVEAIGSEDVMMPFAESFGRAFS
jgi:hypothetical protein